MVQNINKKGKGKGVLLYEDGSPSLWHDPQHCGMGQEQDQGLLGGLSIAPGYHQVLCTLPLMIPGIASTYTAEL